MSFSFLVVRGTADCLRCDRRLWTLFSSMIGRRSTADPSDTLHPIMEVSFDVVISERNVERSVSDN